MAIILGLGFFEKATHVPLDGVGGIFILLIIVPWLAVAVRRLHDVGYSGLWLLVPFANAILPFFDSQKGQNKYGPNPKGAQ